MSGLNDGAHIDELIEAENVANQDKGNESKSEDSSDELCNI